MRIERIHDDDNLEQVKEKLATVIDLLLYEEIKRQSFDKFKVECFDLIQSKEDYHIKKYSELKDETKKEFDNTIKELNENFKNDINGQYNLIEETINKLKDVQNNFTRALNELEVKIIDTEKKSKEETDKVYPQINKLDDKYQKLFMDLNKLEEKIIEEENKLKKLNQVNDELQARITEETQKVYPQIDNLDDKYKNLFMDMKLKVENLEIKNDILVKFIKNISEGVKEL